MTDYPTALKLVQQLTTKRSPYNNHHLVNVAELSRRMGLALGMSKRRLEYVVIGAGLHDMGKLLIPEESLNHNRPLSESEFAIIKQHPVLGYKVARSLKYNPIVLDIILHHHERPDGKGYPDRIKGKAISQEAMIVHIVDVYDALCAKRPYRPAFRPSDAIGIMYSESGTGLDKKLLKIFLDKVLKEHHAK